jgi:hypothetical protein
MQTSIEWFYEQLDSVLELYPSEWVELGKLFHKAKEMHKQEIMNAANTLLYHSTGPGDTAAEQYYQETFKKDL